MKVRPRNQCISCMHPASVLINDLLKAKAAQNKPGEWRRGLGLSFGSIAKAANDKFGEMEGRPPNKAEVLTDAGIRNHARKGHYTNGEGDEEWAGEMVDVLAEAGGKKAVMTRAVISDEGIQLPGISGNELYIAETGIKNVLRTFIVAGITNIRNNPALVEPNHVLRAIDLLHKIDKGASEEDEYMKAIISAIKEDVDPTSPLGAALRQREEALRRRDMAENVVWAESVESDE